jgi:Uma2 family endonuclease
MAVAAQLKQLYWGKGELAMSSVPTPCYSLAEYLKIERLREFKSEYFAGEMLAMAGATANHNLIVSNVNRVLGQQLLDRPCSVYPSNMRTLIQASALCTYPDVIVVCGIAEYLDDVCDTLLSPQLIVEVLSPSTERYDRGRKLEHYRKIDSLQDYVLISQDRRLIECFSRQPDGRWILSEASEIGSSLQLASIDCKLRVEDVYLKVQLEEESTEEK